MAAVKVERRSRQCALDGYDPGIAEPLETPIATPFAERSERHLMRHHWLVVFILCKRKCWPLPASIQCMVDEGADRIERLLTNVATLRFGQVRFDIFTQLVHDVQYEQQGTRIRIISGGFSMSPSEAVGWVFTTGAIY